MFTLNKFCFCIKLEKGGKIVGWSGIFTSLILIIVFILSLTFALPNIVDFINLKFGVQGTSRLPAFGKNTVEYSQPD